MLPRSCRSNCSLNCRAVRIGDSFALEKNFFALKAHLATAESESRTRRQECDHSLISKAVPEGDRLLLEDNYWKRRKKVGPAKSNLFILCAIKSDR